VLLNFLIETVNFWIIILRESVERERGEREGKERGKESLLLFGSELAQT